jgi:hypothetical protein
MNDDAYYFFTFLVGAALLASAFVLGIGALEYEVALQGEVDGAPDGKRFVAQESPTGFEDDTIVLTNYEDLSERDQRLVDRVLAGERLVFRESGDLPGKYSKKGTFAVRRDGTTYLIDRHLFFNWRTPFGLASLALTVVGIAVVSESIRRRQFPHRSVIWTK